MSVPRQERAVQPYGLNDVLVARIGQLMSHFDLDGGKVLYPGSGAHVAVAAAFGKNNVTHVDFDSSAMDTLKNEGYKTKASDIESYEPCMTFDTLAHINSGAMSRLSIDRLLTLGGIIIANNHHGMANQVSEYDDFSMLGAILPDYRAPASELHSGDFTATALGVNRLGVTSESEIVTGDAVDPRTMTVLDTPKSPDGLFLFKQM